jgi:hypothetical protein
MKPIHIPAALILASAAFLAAPAAAQGVCPPAQQYPDPAAPAAARTAAATASAGAVELRAGRHAAAVLATGIAALKIRQILL